MKKCITYLLIVGVLFCVSCKHDDPQSSQVTYANQTTAQRIMPLRLGNIWVYQAIDSIYNLYPPAADPFSDRLDSMGDLRIFNRIYEWKVLNTCFIGTQKFYKVGVSEITSTSNPVKLFNMYLCNENNELLNVTETDVNWNSDSSMGTLNPNVKPDVLFSTELDFIDFAPGYWPSAKAWFTKAPYTRKYIYYFPAKTVRITREIKDLFSKDIGIISISDSTANGYPYPGLYVLRYCNIEVVNSQLISFSVH